MLTKLIKYEIKVTSRTFLPLYGALLVFSFINKLFFMQDFHNPWLNLPKTIFMITYVLLIIAVVAFTIIIIIQRYFKNLLGDEGYLMNTLPVKASGNIISKLITSMIWSASSIFATLISIFIVIADKKLLSSIPEAIRLGLDKLYETVGFNGYIFLLEIIIMAIISLATAILMIYAAISIGQLMNKHRLLSSFGAYLVLSGVTQFISFVIAIILTTIDTPAFISKFEPQTLIHLALAGSLILNMAFAAGYFYISNYILSKKLNLE